MAFGSLDDGDSVDVTLAAAAVAVIVIVLFAGVSAVWRYRPYGPKLPM